MTHVAPASATRWTSIDVTAALVNSGMGTLGAGDGPIRMWATQAVARQISPFWPEIVFTQGMAATVAVLTGPKLARAPAAAIVFGPGLLQPPPRRIGGWSSAIMLGSRQQLGGTPSLLAQQIDAATLARGAAMARRITGDRLGGNGLRRAPVAPRALRLLVAGSDPAADYETLHHLVQAVDAAGVAVLAPAGSPLGRAARRLGCQRHELTGDPWPLLDHATEVHAEPTSDYALLAVLLGRPALHRRQPALPAGPAGVAAAFLVLSTRYIDPASGQTIPCETALDQASQWRRLRQRVPQIGCFAGISFWKRQALADLLGERPAFASTARRAVALAARRGGAIAVWPSRTPAGLADAAAAAGIPLFRVEDGFIRSFGLGADFIPPASVVIDRRGIYYDPRTPSDLDHILASHRFDPALLARAAALIEVLVARNVTKYGAFERGTALEIPAGRRSILVPGQVADDQSVLAGGDGVGVGLDLLREVRAANPDAFILYKPHPDVDAGHRAGALPDASVRQWVDGVVRGVPMATLLRAVDEVHTLTSLAGFEALLRRVSVVTYGRPFYAGWGLTTDLHPRASHKRTLSLEELVAGALLLYPFYMDPQTLLPCGPEHLIEHLTTPGRKQPGALVAGRRLHGALRRRLTQMRFAGVGRLGSRFGA